jgi:putative salt-induced outer membrane protein YdiY
MNMIYKTFLLYIIFQTAAIAQVNTEKYRNLKDDFGFAGTASLDAEINTGNNDKQEFGIEGHFNYNTSENLFLIILKGNYGFVNGQDYSDQALAHFRYLYKLSDVFNIEFFTQFDFNNDRLLLNRKLIGGGIRPVIFRTENSQMWCGISFMYEREKFDLPINSIHASTDNESRLSSYITYRLNIEKNLKLSSVIYFQPEIGSWDDIKVLSENSILVDVIKNVGLNIEINLRYDNRPPDTIKKLDTGTNIGVTISF